MERDEKSDEPTGKLVWDVLHKAFPGRSDEKVVGIGLLYAGVRWGRDFRASAVPHDGEGNLLVDEYDEEQLKEVYDPWLSDILRTVDLAPSEEQAGLCKYVEQMHPEDAMVMLGMHAAMYQHDTEMIEEKLRYPTLYVDGILEDEPAEKVAQVRREIEEQRRYCPDSRMTDLGWRIPLAVALRKVEDQAERIRLLRIFYANYSEYIFK